MSRSVDPRVDRWRPCWPRVGSLELWSFLTVLPIAACGMFGLIAFTPDRASVGIAARRTPPGRAPSVLPAPPVVSPVVYADIVPDDARLSNAAVPLVGGRLAPAPSFFFEGSKGDLSSAQTCLAAAIWYEAGDDPEGERAVAQVVINRVRHPAFPKTICGVVFQGAERSTGCQFTFTCDGSLSRKPSPEAWERAKAIADAALRGHVFKPVGTATHYHTDWVVPYWRDSLDKIAVVHTQIFYRWKGGWGLPHAFVGQLQPYEILDPRLIGLAGSGQPAANSVGDRQADGARAAASAGDLVSLTVPGISEADLKGNIVRLMDAGKGQYVLQLDPSAFPGSYALVAYGICKESSDCVVMGWRSSDAVPRSLPILPTGMRGLSFLYRKSSVTKTEKPYWNCQQMARRDPADCLPMTD